MVCLGCIAEALEAGNRAQADAALDRAFATQPALCVDRHSHIAELDLDTRTVNLFERGGVRTVGELADLTEREAAKIRGVGEAIVDNVKIALRRVGLAFRKDQVPGTRKTT